MVVNVSRFYPLVKQFETQLSNNALVRKEGLLDSLVIESISHPLFEAQNTVVDILRADQLHSVISGNKWFKLKYHLVQAQYQGCSTLISMGGAWSNHLHALAFCANQMGLKTLGVVRGQELTAASNPMLAEAASWGMQFQFVSRAQYKALRGGAWQDAKISYKGGCYLVPEGGDGWLGTVGASTLATQHINDVAPYDEVIVAVGTGCTFAGLRLGLPLATRVVGYSALKGGWQVKSMARRLQNYGSVGPWQLTDRFCLGGFGRSNALLLSFIDQFRHNTGVSLEPVYSAKAMMGLLERVEQQVIKPGSRVLFVHSGGLQGLRGFAQHE